MPSPQPLKGSIYAFGKMKTCVTIDFLYKYDFFYPALLYSGSDSSSPLGARGPGLGAKCL